MENMRKHELRKDGIYKMPEPCPISAKLIESLPSRSATKLEVQGWLFRLLFHEEFESILTGRGYYEDMLYCEWEVLTIRKAPWNGEDLRTRGARQMFADIRLDYHGDSRLYYDIDDVVYAHRFVLAVKMALHLKVSHVYTRLDSSTGLKISFREN
jgi:hypothetical protein